jgi:hypothetical protein
LLEGVRGVVIAPPEWGGYISFYGQGELRPVIDDRNLVVGEEGYRAFYAAFSEGGKWQEYVKSKGARFILFRTESLFAKRLSPKEAEWVVFTDPVATVLDLRKADDEEVF